MKEHRSREHRSLLLSVPANSRVCSRLNATAFHSLSCGPERHLLPLHAATIIACTDNYRLLAGLLVSLKNPSSRPSFSQATFRSLLSSLDVGFRELRSFGRIVKIGSIEEDVHESRKYDLRVIS